MWQSRHVWVPSLIHKPKSSLLPIYLLQVTVQDEYFYPNQRSIDIIDILFILFIDRQEVEF